MSALRLAGVGGPFSLLLSAGAYTLVSETSDHGYPIREHLARVIDGEIIWAPAIDGAFLLSGRGGDFELRLGQDLSIGYLSARRGHRAAVLPGVADVPGLHHRGQRVARRGPGAASRRRRSFVPGRRERVALALDQELVLVVFAAISSARSSWYTLGLGDVLGLRRRVRGRRHLVGVVGVQARGDPLFLGQAGELVVVQVLYAPPCSRRSRWNRSGNSPESCCDIAPPPVVSESVV